MTPRLFVTCLGTVGLRKTLSGRRTWAVWLSLALLGMIVGLWRSHTPYWHPGTLGPGAGLVAGPTPEPDALPEPGPSSRPGQTPSRSSSFVWPLEGYVSSPYGLRTHPILGNELFHEGIDIAAPFGRDVCAAASGKVIFSGWYEGYGRLVIVSHAGGIETWYGHLSDYEVSDGEEVSAGRVIGYVGESGNATGPNLHFEIRKNGTPVNPRDYLP